MTRRDFDDGKDAQALRTIGELGKALEIKPHVLRYWEEQFPMLAPLKRSGGRRYYRPEDVALVETIDRLVNEEGYTLKGARAAIERGRPGPGAAEDRAVGGAGDRNKGGKLRYTASDPAAGGARYLTARDLPDRDQAWPPASFASSQADADAMRRDLLRELKDIRANLAAAIGD